jgi:HEAT repeat protein
LAAELDNPIEASPIHTADAQITFTVRGSAAFKLGKLRADLAVPRLVEMAEIDPNPEARWSAVAALGAIRDRRARPTVVAALDDTHSGVRSWAAISLGKYEDRGAVRS